MNRSSKLLFSSAGKKGIMAVTGCLLGVFVLVHLVGSVLTLFGRDAFNNYSRYFHSLGFGLDMIEIGLLLLFIIHVLFGILLFLEDRRESSPRFLWNSRRETPPLTQPVRDAVQKSSEIRSWGSRTMPYTGLLILCFVLVHVLVNFADYPHIFPSDMVRVALSKPGYALFYILSFIGLTLHISHGFWSMFEDLGISHPAYDRFIQLAALGVSLIIGALFILVPCLAILDKGFLM